MRRNTAVQSIAVSCLEVLQGTSQTITRKDKRDKRVLDKLLRVNTCKLK